MQRKARFGRVLKRIADDAVQPMRPHGPLATGQVAQQAAQGLVPFGDQVLVGALERHAVEPPDAQVVTAARDHVVGADERRERHEAAQGVLGLGIGPVPRLAGEPTGCVASLSSTVGFRHAKHRVLPDRGWARSCARARSGGCGHASAA